jgi:hypothetical protein
MTDIIIIVLLILILGGGIFYIVREKKKGNKCIGCPHAKQCSSKKCACSENREK